MPLAFDSIGFYRTSGGSADTAFQATTVATGDSLTVRSFQNPAQARLERFMYSARTGSAVRVRSPSCHDNVEGLQYFPTQNPSNGLLGEYAPQQLQPQDAMVAEMLVNGTTVTDAAVLGVAYEDLPGISARYHSWQDIAPLLDDLHVLRVTTASGGAGGVWLDTPLTATENLLHANTDYAVLGYITDTALCAVGLKGIDTGNLRVCGPGVLDVNITRDYFIRQSNNYGRPRIPVFNAANAPSTYVTAFHLSTPSNVNVSLICVQLTQRVS
jgi:hypothetical protein